MQSESKILQIRILHFQFVISSKRNAGWIDLSDFLQFKDFLRSLINFCFQRITPFISVLPMKFTGLWRCSIRDGNNQEISRGLHKQEICFPNSLLVWFKFMMKQNFSIQWACLNPKCIFSISISLNTQRVECWIVMDSQSQRKRRFGFYESLQ